MALALLYATVELVRAWSEFENCENPMQIWLLISYFSIALFRVIHILGFPNGTAGNDQSIYDEVIYEKKNIRQRYNGRNFVSFSSRMGTFGNLLVCRNTG